MAQSIVGMVEMSFAERQLSGIYRTGAYRKMIRSFSDAEVDTEVVAKVESAAGFGRGNDPTSMSHFALFWAAGTCAAFVSETLNSEVNTLDIRTWLGLHEALVCANRIVCAPDYVVEDGVSVPDLVMGVALVCDVLCRCADAEAISKAPLPDLEDETVTKRAIGIYRDILCGRVGFWLSAIDDMACQVAMLMGEDFMRLRDTYAAAKTAAYVDALADAFSLSVEQASAVMASQVMSFATLFDTHQATIWDASAKNMSVPSKEVREAVFHPDLVAAFVESAPSALCDSGSHLRAFCLSSGVSAVDSVFFVPTSVSEEIVVAMGQLEQ